MLVACDFNMKWVLCAVNHIIVETCLSAIVKNALVFLHITLLTNACSLWEVLIFCSTCSIGVLNCFEINIRTALLIYAPTYYYILVLRCTCYQDCAFVVLCVYQDCPPIHFYMKNIRFKHICSGNTLFRYKMSIDL